MTNKPQPSAAALARLQQFQAQSGPQSEVMPLDTKLSGVTEREYMQIPYGHEIPDGWDCVASGTFTMSCSKPKAPDERGLSDAR